jgi:hypothetical protein
VLGALSDAFTAAGKDRKNRIPLLIKGFISISSDFKKIFGMLKPNLFFL